MSKTWRPFVEGDYRALVALYNRLRPESPISEAFARHHMSSRKDDYLFNEVLEQQGALIAAAWALKDGPLERPVHLELLLHPEHADGAGRDALYRHAMARLEPVAKAVTVRLREDETPWLELYLREGFREFERQWESVLEVSNFNPTPFEGAFARAKAAGVVFKTVADLPDSESTQRLLYDAITGELLPDVPFAEPLHIWPFELWRKRVWKSPTKNPESWFLAFRGGELVGLSELDLSEDETLLQTGLTAVRRDARRQGVAMSLKLLGVAYAKAQGKTRISTMNHSINRPMLAINEALGFVKRPAWLQLRKKLEMFS